MRFWNLMADGSIQQRLWRTVARHARVGITNTEYQAGPRRLARYWHNKETFFLFVLNYWKNE
jgi:hypothetical protein